MALSRQEQDVLDEIEQGLREDPSFAAGLDPGRVRRHGRRRALALAVPGLLLLLPGRDARGDRRGARGDPWRLRVPRDAAGLRLALASLGWSLVPPPPVAEGRV